jgi:hypothetical protein
MSPCPRARAGAPPQVSTQGGVSANGGASMPRDLLGGGYGEVAWGLFVAPLTTTYAFSLLSFYASDLRLSTNDSTAGLRHLCNVTYGATR